MSDAPPHPHVADRLILSLDCLKIKKVFFIFLIFLVFFFTGYWPSYNVPFFEEIYNQSGYNKVYGFKSNQYQMAARAKLFRRDANKVYDLQSMKNLLRSNSEFFLLRN